MLFNTFICTEIDNESRLEDYLVLKCYEGEHGLLTYVHTIPFLIFWIVLYPLSIFIYLRKNRKNLESQAVKTNAGFIIEGYTLEYYYWEFIIMIRKYCIILISIFVKDISVLILSLLLVIMLFLYL